MLNPETSNTTESVLRRLSIVWADFETRLNTLPIVSRAFNGNVRLEDYRILLADHYHQVMEGSGWISRAASQFTQPHLELRSAFIRHAQTEHRDFEMLERCYVACGGESTELRNRQKNIGSAALSAWMYHRASGSNPIDLLGAMFIIEGLGRSFARRFADAVRNNLSLSEEHVEFYTYHAEHDETHLEEFEAMLDSGVLSVTGVADAIVRTAKVTARLYLLQIEELGNY